MELPVGSGPRVVMQWKCGSWSFALIVLSFTMPLAWTTTLYTPSTEEPYRELGCYCCVCVVFILVLRILHCVSIHLLNALFCYFCEYGCSVPPEVARAGVASHTAQAPFDSSLPSCSLGYPSSGIFTLDTLIALTTLL